MQHLGKSRARKLFVLKLCRPVGLLYMYPDEWICCLKKMRGKGSKEFGTETKFLKDWRGEVDLKVKKLKILCPPKKSVEMKDFKGLFGGPLPFDLYAYISPTNILSSRKCGRWCQQSEPSVGLLHGTSVVPALVVLPLSICYTYSSIAGPYPAQIWGGGGRLTWNVDQWRHARGIGGLSPKILK